LLTISDLKMIRNIYGLKQKELALKTGLSFSLISAIERGERNINYESDRRIRSSLNLSDEIIESLINIRAGLRI
jgi:transcriptional regulator with XRE-family HTH domain